MLNDFSEKEFAAGSWVHVRMKSSSGNELLLKLAVSFSQQEIPVVLPEHCHKVVHEC